MEVSAFTFELSEIPEHLAWDSFVGTKTKIGRIEALGQQ